MSKRVWMRFVAAAAAVLFILGGAGDLVGRHLCPHHDGALAAQLAQAVGEAAHADGHGASEHGEAAHGCTCVGDCVSAPGVALPTASTVLVGAAPVDAFRELPAGESKINRKRPSYLLPWSNGPPVLV